MPPQRRGGAHAGGARDDVDAVVGLLQQLLRAADPLGQQPLQRGRAGLLAGETKMTGVASAGEIFDAPAFLRALSPHIKLETDVVAR
jgi:hypothetical protein